MSLHKFAEQVAANGRGDDSLLVHMTPDEVRKLQQFAEANGTTLTINPETGLPEAGLLSDLFKTVAPIALGAFLGPAGFGLSSMMAGVATGGITALATGSLSRGLMAGLGAYGGAGLGASLAGAGESALGANLGTSLTDTQAQSLGFQNAGTAAQTNALATAPVDKLTAGFNAATASPSAAMDFAKANYKPLLAAAAPIAAGMMVPTNTKLETPKSDNYIRQFDFNINPDTGKPDPLYGVRAMTPVKASEWGDKTLQGQRELFRQQNPNPYELGVGSLNQPPQQQPKPMATGGIVALADGGVPGYAGGSLVSDQQIFDYFAKPTPGRDDAQIARDMQTYNVTAADIARATGTQNQQADYERRFAQAVATPTTSAQEFLDATSDVGLQNQALANAMQGAGMSQAAQYASTHGLADTAPITGTDFYNQIGYKPGALPGDQGGLEGLYANINYAAQGLQNQIAAGKMTGQQARDAALAEMNRVRMSDADLKAATGKTLAELFPDTKTVVKPPPFTSVVPGGTQLPGATTYDNDAYGNYGSGPATGVDYKGNTVSIATPGDIITNPDQTRTVTPNLPGRPTGGFTGIDQIKSAYTAGGGSLGYTARAPKTIAEFNQMHNKQTGDSLAAYNYLMGKGANPIKSSAPKIAENYNEFVLGKKTAGLKPVTKNTSVTGTPGQPQTYFNEAEYLAANPDVAAELKSGKAKFANAYEHYLMYGKAEGRPFAGDYQGYLTAAALASAAGAGGGGEGPGPAGANNSGTISGFTPAPPDMSIPEASMGIGEGNDGNTGGGPGTGADGDAAFAYGGLMPRGYAVGGGLGSLGSYSDGGRLLKGPGDGVSDSIPATIGAKRQPARLADGEFVIPARIVSELGNGSTDAGAKKLYAMMDRVQRARGKTTGKNKVAANSRADKHLPA